MSRKVETFGDTLYVVEYKGKPLKVGKNGQNAFMRRQDAKALITKLTSNRWYYAWSDADPDEFEIVEYRRRNSENA